MNTVWLKSRARNFQGIEPKVPEFLTFDEAKVMKELGRDGLGWVDRHNECAQFNHFQHNYSPIFRTNFSLGSLVGSRTFPQLSMPPYMLVLMAFAYRYDSAITGALYQVTAQKLGHAFQRRSTYLTLHSSNAIGGKAADNSAVAVVNFVAVVQQPVANQRRNSTLL